MTPPSEPLYPVTNGTKICSKPDCKHAGLPQPTSQFEPHKGIACGLSPMCRTCRSKQRRAWHRTHPDETRVRSAKSRNSEAGKRYRAKIKESQLVYLKEWQKNNPDRIRHLHLVARFRAYGVTPNWYNEKLEEQRGKCAICGTSDPKSNGVTFHVDHDHRCCTKECHACDKCRRGLLCGPCNSKLGHLENVEWTKKALAYLRRYAQIRLPGLG